MCPLAPAARTPAVDLVPSVGTTPMSLVRLARAIAPRPRGACLCVPRASTTNGAARDDRGDRRGERRRAASRRAPRRALPDRRPLPRRRRSPTRWRPRSRRAGERVAALVVIDAMAPLPLDHAATGRAVDSPATAAMVAQLRPRSPRRPDRRRGAARVPADARARDVARASRRSCALHLDASASLSRGAAARADARDVHGRRATMPSSRRWDRYSPRTSRAPHGAGRHGLDAAAAARRIDSAASLGRVLARRRMTPRRARRSTTPFVAPRDAIEARIARAVGGSAARRRRSASTTTTSTSAASRCRRSR